MAQRRWGVTGLAIPLSSILLLGACEPAKSPAERARDDARAVGMVEAAQTKLPPPVPLDPEPISPSDIQGAQLEPACRFALAGSAVAPPVLLVNARRAMIKSEARFIALAADSGSQAIAPGVRAHYVGKAQSLVLDRSPGDGAHPGEFGLRWPARVEVHDAWNQLVYAATGELDCPA